MQNWGILGGTFDPVHWGHLLMAETALIQADLDKVIWVPSFSPPHKQAMEFEHRSSMVQLAIADHPSFALAPVEANLQAIDYAIHSLNYLQSLYPHTHWHWIIGMDAFTTLPRWYRRQELITICDWLVAPRPSTHVQLDDTQVAQQLALQGMTIRSSLLAMPSVGISSSLIRQYCRQGRSIRYLVPEAVRIYIDTHKLYSN
jgi:nicotinate-nucleotide adenylyltransferase